VLEHFELRALAARSSRSLSGGEQQRVALARALSVEPRALLLDEPLAALDLGARRQVRALLARHLRELALPTVIVTHDPLDALALGERIAVLEAGKLVQLGTLAELAARPASAFVAEFAAAATS
jgi:molybdate transport system ATP-binding protein